MPILFFHTVPLHMGWGRILLDFCSTEMEHQMFPLPLHTIKKWHCQKQVILCQFSSEEASDSKTAKTIWQTLAWIMGIFVASGFLNHAVSNPSRSRQHCCWNPFLVFWIKTKGASDWVWWSPDCQEPKLGYKHLSRLFQPVRSGLAALLLPAGACPGSGQGFRQRLLPCARGSACPAACAKPRGRAALTELCPKPGVQCHPLTSLRIPGSPRDAAAALTVSLGSGPRPPPPLPQRVTVARAGREDWAALAAAARGSLLPRALSHFSSRYRHR